MTRDMVGVDRAAALQAGFKILDTWGALPNQQRAILAISARDFGIWKMTPGLAQLGGEQLERLDCILNIHAHILALVHSPSNVADYVRLPNLHSPFEGRSPLDCLGGGSLALLYGALAHLATTRQRQAEHTKVKSNGHAIKPGS